MKAETIEVIEDKDDNSAEKIVSSLLLDILNNLPLVNILISPSKFHIIDIPEDVSALESSMMKMDERMLLIIGYGLLTNGVKDSLKQLLKFTKDDGFILSREKRNTSLDLSILEEFQLRLILEKRTSEESWILFTKIIKIQENTIIINVKSNVFNWLQQVHTVLIRNEEQNISNTSIILFEEGNFESGLLRFINWLQKEFG